MVIWIRAAQDERLLQSPQPCVKAQEWYSLQSNILNVSSTLAIAEQHAVTLAAGMACEGLKPVIADLFQPFTSVAMIS